MLHDFPQPGQGVGASRSVSQVSPEHQALLETGACQGEVSKKPGKSSKTIECLSSIPGVSRHSGQRQGALEPATALAQIPPQIPEPREGITQAQCVFSGFLCNEPMQRPAQVVLF